MRTRMTMLAAALALAMWAAPAALAVEEMGGQVPAQAQAAPPSFPDADAMVREAHHLNTIGTYSAGFVLQSYGYIGVLADVFSQHIYDPDMIRSMLGETITYLNNARNQLQYYESPDASLRRDDREFILSVSNIINDLILEAEALSDFTESLQESDLTRFQEARKDAWGRIKTLLGVK